MKKEQLHINRGFSLVELLVAISIFLVFVIVVTDVVRNVSTEMRNSANRERAMILAEEAFEASRNIRDENFANLIDGTYGFSTSSNQWNFSGTSDITDIFTRVLNISTISPEVKKLDVTISWADQISSMNSLTSSTYLTNWRAILNRDAGLTVNKSVINHGGSKVASDFAPYQVGTTTIDLGVANLIPEGTYTISETTDPDYTQTFSGDCDSGGSINLIASTTNTCVITNEEKPSKLIVNKSVINHGQTKISSDFSILVDSNPVISGALNTFNSGLHIVSEIPDAEYTATFGGNCNSSGQVTLTPGTTKTCSIVNEEKPASIVVNKVVINHGGSKIASDFAPYQVGATTITLGATTTFDSGNYTVSEATSSTHTVSFSGDCDSSGSITLVGGLTKYCTITNEQILVIPTVTTTSPIGSITRTTASGGGNVTSDGGANVTARGVVWDTSANPTIALSTKTSDGTGTGSFSSSLTSLICNTLYYVRAYATNSVGTAYGSDVTFTTSACSTITFVGATAVTGTTGTIPAHNVGDLLVAFAYRDGNNTAPSLASGWTNINSSTGSNSNSTRLAYRIATGSDTASGWTNATEVIIHVYRGQSASPIGANATQAGNSTTVTYPTLALTVTDGTSWIVGFAGDRNTNTTLENSPTNMTQRSTRVDGTAEVSSHDTNGGVSSWSATSVPVGGTNTGWKTNVLEIKSQ